MKKLLTLTAAFMLCMTLAQAGPVDVEKAQLVGKRFVSATFAQNRQDLDLHLVYTGAADRSAPCFYVFNVDDDGFVIVSADDRFRPITGYSDQGAFDTENMSPELEFYLGKIIEARMSPDVVLYDDAAAEWESLLKDGKTLSRNGGKGVPFLCQTLWNQDSPYNLYSPEAGSGPGGRCYAGCVATAMSQVMRFWNHPLQGQGSHGYYSSYGYLSANYGATTYDWDNMPYRISGSSPEEEIEAIALLMYHCGVSVNMGFSPNGSGAYSDDVPGAIHQYFGYSNQAENTYRDYYSLNQWKSLLKQQFDLGWPVYYSGHSDTGGHAFVCDGYDDNDLFHYNWGWGGSNDGWFVIDEIDYANWAAAIINFVPSDIYQYMPQEPENLTVESQGDADFSAVLTWTNPSTTIHDAALGTIDEIVICRDGQPIHTISNPTPGQAMSYTDHFLPVSVSYSIYAVTNNVKGKVARTESVILGPTCPWFVTMTSDSPQGWEGACIIVKDGRGTEIANIKASSASQTASFEMPLGTVTFSWQVTSNVNNNIQFEIKDASQLLKTMFSGSSLNLKNGVFYQAVNNCLEGDKLTAPSNLTASSRDGAVVLSWEMEQCNECSFLVYRDGLLYDIADEASYTDVNHGDAFHVYRITAFNGTVESDPSNACNIQPESDCQQPTNLRYRIEEGNKILLSWNPVNGASGYKVYRRPQGGEFSRVKLTSSTSCEMGFSAMPCDLYEVAVTAYFAQDHCESAFASTKADPTLNFVEVNNTVIPMRLSADVNEDGVRLVWLQAMMADAHKVYRNGSTIAFGVSGNSYLDVDVTVGQDYCYTVVGENPQVNSNHSNEICVDWSTMDLETAAEQQVTVYPNPARDQVYVSAAGLKHLEVINLLGQVVMTSDVDEDNTVVDLSSLKQGAYFLRVVSTAGNTTVKFVKL
ncbi:MAG: thiol protease/hemagglutinin PrtT [Bacteroidales bacterium]|nr:thiol protease/hemagglutinin PrtT [Bacteroidales bacterium]